MEEKAFNFSSLQELTQIQRENLMLQFSKLPEFSTEFTKPQVSVIVDPFEELKSEFASNPMFKSLRKPVSPKGEWKSAKLLVIELALVHNKTEEKIFKDTPKLVEFLKGHLEEYFSEKVDDSLTFRAFKQAMNKKYTNFIGRMRIKMKKLWDQEVSRCSTAEGDINLICIPEVVSKLMLKCDPLKEFLTDDNISYFSRFIQKQLIGVSDNVVFTEIRNS